MQGSRAEDLDAVNRPRFEHDNLLRAADIEAALRAYLANVHRGSLRNADGKGSVDGRCPASGPNRQDGLVNARLQDAVRRRDVKELTERLVGHARAIEGSVVLELDDRIATARERPGNTWVEWARVYGRVRADDSSQRRGSAGTDSFGTAKLRDHLPSHLLPGDDDVSGITANVLLRSNLAPRVLVERLSCRGLGGYTKLL